MVNPLNSNLGTPNQRINTSINCQPELYHSAVMWGFFLYFSILQQFDYILL